MKIPLNRGLYAIVDDEDAPAVLTRRWAAYRDKGHLAIRAVDPGPRIRLSHFIIGEVRGEVVFANANRLDCTRGNLLVIPQPVRSQRRNFKTGVSGYRGVSREERLGCWRGQIVFEGRQHWLGHFSTPEAAARAYDEAARKLFGDDARVNFA
jgi:AP2 domain